METAPNRELPDTLKMSQEEFDAYCRLENRVATPQRLLVKTFETLQGTTKNADTVVPELEALIRG